MSEPETDRTTALIKRAFEEDDSEAKDELFSALHGELHSMATRKMWRERDDHSWQPSDLVQNCCIQLLKDELPNIASKDELFKIISRIMWQLLVQHARKKKTAKRGGEIKRSHLDERINEIEGDDVVVEDLDEVLVELKRLHPRQFTALRGWLVAGMDVRALAVAMEASTSQVYNDLNIARGFVHSRLRA